jgi:hypothetical protein
MLFADISKACLPGFAADGKRSVAGMKKALLLGMVCGLVGAGVVFGADSWSVRSVAGQAHRLGPAGQWIAVSEGDLLSPSAIIRIGLDSALTLANGDAEQVLRSARQGALESFLGSGAAGAEGRVSVGGRAVDSDASSPSGPAIRTPVQERELDWAE